VPELRVLALTPDFPPDRGGIQTLVAGLVANAIDTSWRVVAFGDLPSDGGTRRVSRTGRSHVLDVARLNAAALDAAREARPDVVVSAHVVTSPAARVIGRTLRIPIVQYLHGVEAQARPRLCAFAARSADAVIAVSRHTASLARQAGAREAAIHTIPPGVDVPENVLRRPGSTRTLVTVSQLAYRYKGHDVIARALPLVAAKVPDVRWVVVGDGPLRGFVQELVSSYGVADRLVMTGTVSDTARDTILDEAHIFCMPSRVPASGVGGEGFGIAYLEASARGLPVVAARSGGTVDAVIDGETGLLVEPLDHLGLADAVSGLLLESGRAERMGAAGRERAREFAWPRIVAHVDEVLGALAARPNSSSTL
jgi:phosphatidyl-myo-inositol dimannoside synthase